MVETRPANQGNSWEALLEFAHLPEAGAILCVGEGSSALATFLGRRGHQTVAVSSHGCDAGDDTLSLVTDPQDMGLRSGVFDAVVLVDLFHRQKDPEAALAEARRVAKAGCWLLIQEPVAEGDESSFLTMDEFCAHLAGESLGVLAHRQVVGNSGNLALWLLRVPQDPPEPTRTFIQEDR